MSDTQFIFCEGCGARLSSQDRSCPKCGHPAPGILSTNSAASDLAAGKTASFPRLTQDRIESSIPTTATSEPTFDTFNDPDATGVLNADMLASVSGVSRNAGASSGRSAYGFATDAAAMEESAFGPRHHRKRWIAITALVALVAGGVFFVAADPLGVMPGFYAQVQQAASESFPSRQAPEDGEAQVDASTADSEQEGDGTLSEAEAFTRLDAIYERILEFQTALGPVVEDYNGYYIADDRTLREESSASAYALRDTIQATLDELSNLKLAEDTAYAEDVEHLTQLATWMYNRVDVLCRSWDISLGLPEGERPLNHQDEILQPLRDVEMVDGKAVDVIEYENNVANWRPVQK